MEDKPDPKQHVARGTKRTAFEATDASSDNMSDPASKNAKRAYNGKNLPSNSKALGLVKNFPVAEEILLLNRMEKTERDRVCTFLTMYRTHSQRYLETCIRASFVELPGYALHFWHGMPEHLRSVTSQSLVVQIVQICDKIVYGLLEKILVPKPVTLMPESIQRELQVKLLLRMPLDLPHSLQTQPRAIRAVKMSEMSSFLSRIRQKLEISQLSHSVAEIWKDNTILNVLRIRWSSVDVHSNLTQLMAQSFLLEDKVHDVLMETAKNAIEKVTAFIHSDHGSVEKLTCILSNAYTDSIGLLEEHANMHPVESAQSFALLIVRFFGMVQNPEIRFDPHISPLEVFSSYAQQYVLELVETLVIADEIERLRKNLRNGVELQVDAASLEVPVNNGERQESPTGDATRYNGNGAATGTTTPGLSRYSSPQHSIAHSPLFQASLANSCNSVMNPATPTMETASVCSATWNQPSLVSQHNMATESHLNGMMHFPSSGLQQPMDTGLGRQLEAYGHLPQAQLNNSSHSDQALALACYQQQLLRMTAQNQLYPQNHMLDMATYHQQQQMADIAVPRYENEAGMPLPNGQMDGDDLLASILCYQQDTMPAHY